MDVCDPDAKTKNIRKLIKLHTGHAVNVSRERMCDITREAKKGNLPMPPLVLTRDKRFLLDSKSPLTQKDYETLYKSNTTSADAKRLAKKVGLVNTDKTIADLKDAIGRRLASTSVREPILLPGSRAVSAPKSENFFANENRNTVQNENRNNENQNRNNENQNRANINSARRNNGDRPNGNVVKPNGNVVKPNGNVVKPNGNRPKSMKNTIRNRHKDRIKDFSKNRREPNRREPNRREPNRREPNGKKPGFFGRIFGGSKNTSTNKLNTEMKLAQMKRNTQRQVSHQKTVQSRLRLREAKLAKNMISEAEREKRQAINDVTRMQNNKHLLEVELNRRANRARKNAETVSQSKKELAKEKLHAGGLNTRIAALRRRATVEREQAKKNLKEKTEALRLAMNTVNNKTKNIGLKQSEINKAKANLNAASKKTDAYKKSTDSALAKIQELTKQLETAGNAGNSEKVKTLEVQIAKLLKELEELKKTPVTVVQNVELIAKKIELTRLAGVQGVNFTKNINKLTMNNLKGSVLKNNFGKNTQTKLAPKVLALENKIKAAGKAKKAKKNTELAAIEKKRQEEMNTIRAEKEKAITNAAANKATAVKEAEEAAKAQATANTAEERAKALANLQAAQVKINAANEERTKALEKAKEEREQALTTAASNKEAALLAAKTASNANKAVALTNAAKKAKANRITATRNAAQKARERQKAENNKNKNAALVAAKTASNTNKVTALTNAAKKAKANRITATRNAAQKARNRQKAESEAKLNQIREEKNKALAEAATNKNKAQFEANAARKALVAGRFQSAANKAALEKRVTEAEANIKRAATEKVEALEEAERKRKEALEEAESNKKNAMKGAVALNRMKGAINAKKNARTSIQNRLRAKAQAARNSVAEKKKKAQDELRALATSEDVNFTRNINRVTLNGVNTLKTRIKNAGKTKRIAKAKAGGEEKRLARQKANDNKRKQNARNTEANRVATVRRIALEQKQAAAKKRRELQEQGRGKRIAEKTAAKANAKKEENNMNARMKTTRNKVATNKAAANKAAANKAAANKAAEADARMNAIVAIKRDYANTVYSAGGLITNEEKAYWIEQGNQMGLAMSYRTKTEKNFKGLKKMFMDNLNRVKRNKNIKNAKNAAAVKIQATFKGGQVRKSVGGSSMGQDILKKHISGINVMAGQSIPGFTGKRLEDGGYEKKWLQRVDEEGDTAVKRAKLKKIFDDKFELKKTLLKNEKTNVRTGYRLGQLRSLKSQVMRPFYRQDSSTKGTDRNAAALNVVRIDKQIDEAKSVYAKKILDQQAINMKKAGQKFKTYNNPISTNNKMPKKTRVNPRFNMVPLGEGGNKNINGVNMTLKRAKPSLKNITQKKIIRPSRMAGNSLLKAGQITQAKKNAVGNVAGARKAYANQAKFAIEQKKKRAKQRVVNSLKGKAGKNQIRYMKMINTGQINQAMKEVDRKVMQHPGLKIQPKLT